MTRIVRSILRHVFGYLVFFPALVLAILLQALVANGLFGNQTTIPHLIYRACGVLLGVRFEMNPNSAPVENGKSTMFVANHLARFDFIGLNLFPNSVVMMNANILKIPIWGPIIRVFAGSSGFVPTKQVKEQKPGDLDQLGQAVEQKRNIFIFPEGIQSDGLRVLRYSVGTAEIFYDKDLISKYPSLKNAQMQPVILRVKDIDGKSVFDDPKSWGAYTLVHQLRHPIIALTYLSLIRSITIDVLICPPLSPSDYASAESLVNAAHDLTRAIIAPDQTETLTRRQWRDRIKARDFSV